MSMPIVGTAVDKMGENKLQYETGGYTTHEGRSVAFHNCGFR